MTYLDHSEIPDKKKLHYKKIKVTNRTFLKEEIITIITGNKTSVGEQKGRNVLNVLPGNCLVWRIDVNEMVVCCSQRKPEL